MSTRLTSIGAFQMPSAFFKHTMSTLYSTNMTLQQLPGLDLFSSSSPLLDVCPEACFLIEAT